MDKWFNLNVNASLGEVDIFGEIGGLGVYADDFISEIEALGSTRLRVNISSLGGDVNQALQIHDYLKAYKGKVTVRVTGFTASAGTFIAMAGDVIEMSENALFLIHQSWTGVMGNADDMRETIDTLEKIDDIQARIYSQRTGLTEKDVRELMAEERWMKADEAKEKGFVDKIISAEKISAKSLDAVYAKIDSKELPSANFNIKNNEQMAEKNIIEAINAKFEEVKASLENLFKGENEAEVETIAKADAEALVEAAKKELDIEANYALEEKEDVIKAKDEEIEALNAKIAEAEVIKARVEELEAEIAKARATKVETPKAEETGDVETPKAAELNGFDLLAAKIKK